MPALYEQSPGVDGGAYIYSFSTQEVETGGIQIQDHPWLQLVRSYSGLYERPCLKRKKNGWRAGPEIKSTGYSSRGSRFSSQHPHGSSQLSLTLVPKDLTPSHRHTCR
uniref:cAMP protein n=1 Tax=Mus musculus TaxID=10090 RepID=Q9WU73_MOUSE|nr:putative CAMP protein [Mus musculus]AAI45147.1 Vesicle-associated membrane protein 5 [Mus musculus]AAK38123.1 CAMP protein [Mus musculus]